VEVFAHKIIPKNNVEEIKVNKAIFRRMKIYLNQNLKYIQYFQLLKSIKIAYLRTIKLSNRGQILEIVIEIFRF